MAEHLASIFGTEKDRVVRTTSALQLGCTLLCVHANTCGSDPDPPVRPPSFLHVRFLPSLLPV